MKRFTEWYPHLNDYKKENNNNNNKIRKKNSTVKRNSMYSTSKEILRISLSSGRFCFVYNDPFWHANITIVVTVAVAVVCVCVCVCIIYIPYALSFTLPFIFCLFFHALPFNFCFWCAYYSVLWSKHVYEWLLGSLSLARSLCLSVSITSFWFVLPRLSYSLYV